MSRFLVAGFVSFFLVPCAVGQGSTPTLQTLLRPGPNRAELLEAWVPPRLQELTRKLQAAAQADPAWFREHAASAAPGEPLPYHPKLGMTPAEHDELVRLASNTEMRATDTVSVAIVATPRGYRLGAGTDVPSLRALEIDTVAAIVRSSIGVLAATDPITPNQDQRATGQWAGLRWKLEEVNQATQSGTQAQFAVGRHVASGRTIIYYDVTKVAGGQITLREIRFLKLLP